MPPMAGEPLIGADTMPEDLFLEPEKLLRDLAEAPVRPIPNAQDASLAAAPQQYCSSCWGVLPSDSAHCPNCGRSIEEMEAARQSKRATDRAWTPPRQAASSASPEAASHALTAGLGAGTVVAGPVVPEPLARELRKSRHHFLMAVAIGSAWGGAVMVAAWFTIQSMSPAKQSPPSTGIKAAIAQPASEPDPVSTANVPASPVDTLEPPAVQVQPKPDARVVWNNPYSELRAELYSQAGRKVAVQGEDARVAAGKYQVRIFPRTGDWHIEGAEINAADGQLLEVGVTPQQAGLFFQRLGDRFYDAQKVDDAVSAWQRAVEIDPKQIRAHLRLGTTLPLQHRYRDAREHLDAVLSALPNDREALEGVRLLDELEKLR